MYDAHSQVFFDMLLRESIFIINLKQNQLIKWDHNRHNFVKKIHGLIRGFHIMILFIGLISLLCLAGGKH